MLGGRTFGNTFDQKEREIKSPQVQLKEMDDFLRASLERKPKSVENSFFNPHTFPTYFTRPEKISPFYPTYASSPPDFVKYIPITHKPKFDRTNSPSTTKKKGKVVYLSTSS